MKKNYIEQAVALVNKHKNIVLFYLVAALALKGFSINYAHNEVTPFLSLFLSFLLNATISAYFIFNLQKKVGLNDAFKKVKERIASILGYSFIFMAILLFATNRLALTPNQLDLFQTGLSFLTLFVLPLILFSTKNPIIAMVESITLVLENLITLLIGTALIGISALLVLLVSMGITSAFRITTGPVILLSEIVLLTYLITIFSALISVIYVDQYKGR